MSSYYSRQKKSKTPVKIAPTKQIKTGLTALQKLTALVGSILSIIVATLTISRYLNPTADNPKSDSSNTPTSTIVKIIEKDSSNSSKTESDPSDTPSNTEEHITSPSDNESKDSTNSASENDSNNPETSTENSPEASSNDIKTP